MLFAMKALPRRRVFLAPVMLGSLALAIRAQTPVPEPSFEVATIRLADANAKPFPPGVLPITQFPTNHFYLHNISLEQIVATAYNADQRHIEGPNWMES